MNPDNDTELYDRIGKKKQKSVTVSREFIAVLDHFVADRLESRYIEEAAWRRLINEHGETAVREAIEAAQADLDDDETLPESRSYTITLDA